MLSVESVRSSTKSEREDDGGGSFLIGVDDDFTGGNCLLDDINFDDLFVEIEDGDLPDLEMDSEILAEFSSVEESTSCSPDHLLTSSPASASGESCLEEEKEEKEEKKEKVDDNVDQESSAVTASDSASSGRKPASSTSTKVPQGKRKVKVDWTPELHRRFVQAVEQLGVDKAVPSRILELMGIDCLTRHNIASHLQKYRSHRKHLLAREAEAANWSQRRQLYGGGRGGGGGGGGGKREMAAPWVVPTIGFLPPCAVQAPFRPLHVWGHPHPHPGAVDQPPPMVQVWPKHLVRSPSPSPPPLPWVPPAAASLPHPPPYRPPFWLPHHHLGGSHMTHGTPYYSPPLTPPHRFCAPVPVPGIPQAMFKADANVNTLPSPGPPNSHLHIIDFHIPSKESIDAALEDVLAQPWLPLPLGLKPPSTESVLVELQRQGISKIPPSCA